MRLSPWVAAAAGTLVLAVGAAALINQLGGEQVPAHVPGPAAKPTALAEPTSPTPPPTSTPTPAAVPDTATAPAPAPSGPELVIPSVGLRAPLLPLEIAGNRVSPPSYADAFWLNGAGFGDVHQTSTPTAIAFHANTDPKAGALGDQLWDRNRQQSKVHTNDLMIADGVPFKVTKTFTQPKEGADRRDAAWTTPGTLLIVTCAETPDAVTTGVHANSNLILVAERVS